MAFVKCQAISNWTSQIQAKTAKYSPIQANTAKYKQLQPNTIKYSQIQACTNNTNTEMYKINFGQDFETVLWFRFWNWILSGFWDTFLVQISKLKFFKALNSWVGFAFGYVLDVENGACRVVIYIVWIRILLDNGQTNESATYVQENKNISFYRWGEALKELVKFT